MTDRLTQIAGQVSDARGQTLRDYVVVILPAEAKQEPVVAGRWIRTARPDSNGRFETRGMRPGRYVATAIEDLEQGRQFAPEFQEQLRRNAREFTVREGETLALEMYTRGECSLPGGGIRPTSAPTLLGRPPPHGGGRGGTLDQKITTSLLQDLNSRVGN